VVMVWYLFAFAAAASAVVWQRSRRAEAAEPLGWAAARLEAGS